MITCLQASALISRSFDVQLGGEESRLVEQHTRACPACLRYARELELIRRCCRELVEEALGEGGAPLPEGSRRRLQARLELALQG
ncbi:MAG TPA: hypothetical protein PK668_03210 [Myxococcota bacterium]|nr:hypothetical protein [Myxococcota bacterium]HRY91863.1 hypothetical protein [Myxococcota bacterium]HSA23065.1 hypothetical protein [Myxococcota bacterium]